MKEDKGKGEFNIDVILHQQVMQRLSNRNSNLICSVGHRANMGSMATDPIAIDQIAIDPIAKDAMALVNELRVRQIELKVQNEELKQANLEMKEELAKYYDMHDSSPIGLFTLNSKGRVLAANLYGALLLGAERGSLMRKRFVQFIAAKDHWLFDAFLKRISENPAKETCELSLLKRSGSAIYVRIEGMAIKNLLQIDKQYRIAVIDITERKLMEEEITLAKLRAEEMARAVEHHAREIEAAFSSIADGVIVYDKSANILYINEAAKKIIGLDEIGRANPSSERKTMIVSPDGRPFRYEELPFDRAVKGELIRDFEMVADSGPDRQFTILASAAPIYDNNGKIAGVVSTMKDITERRRAEEALRKSRDKLEQQVLERTADLARTNKELIAAKEAADSAARAKAAFLANMSHEIRTPLSAVIGLIDLLERTDLNREQQDYVETIKGSGNLLLSAINGILDFSKIDSGKAELEEQPFEIRGSIEDSLDIVSIEASKKGLNLAYAIDSGVPGSIIGDHTRLRQILINLLINAIKFTDKGDVRVEISSRKLKGNSYEVHFAVIDTGIGISGDKIGSLFQPFSQADALTTSRYGGTGLGLVICKRLVEMLGGRIWAESVAGKGSTFRFFIRAEATAKKPTNPGTDMQHQIIHPELSQLSDLRILLAEDNPINQKVAVQMLHKIGFEADIAANGLEVLRALERQTYDIILMDIQMPEMDGIEASKKVRERWHDGLKIIAVTACALEGDMKRCLEAGMDDYISKPIKLEDLQRKLIKWGMNNKMSDVYS